MSNASDNAVDSVLGRHDYWEETYKQELRALHETGDEGEIWFGQGVLKTMVQWTLEMLCKSSLSKNTPILDVGTGNGSFLFALAQKGYRNLTGSDYSQSGLDLAKAIAAKKQITHITWELDDILCSKFAANSFQIVCDKGTFDAIGLSAQAKESVPKYVDSLWRVLDVDGILIITSCNNTAGELQELFCKGQTAERKFVLLDKVKTYPVFFFGGVEGTKVCTVAFKRNSKV